MDLLLRFRTCERGISAIEFGLLSPLLVVLFLGMVDFGGAFIKKTKLESAARAGAQYALLKGYDETTVQEVIEGSTTLTDITFDTLSTSCACEDGTAVTCGDTCADGSTNRKWVTVTLSTTVTPFFFGDLISSVSATVEMQIQ